MRILIVEDEKGIVDFLSQGLSEAGYSIDVARDGISGLEYAIGSEYDLILLDIMLPKMSGLALLGELRRAGNKTPVIMLTARGAIDDKVHGLDAGADDYLVKPFAFAELLARIRALMRRPKLSVDTVISFKDIELDTVRHEVRRAGERVELSGREFSILEYFMRNPNQVLTRTQIAEHIWNFDSYAGSNVVDVYIGYLRKKIDVDPAKSCIKTIRGVGYKFSTDDGV